MMNKEALVIVALAYLVGSIPFGLILSKVFASTDIRKAGSGNIGATNVSRVLGKKLGALTLIFDILKGALFVIVAEEIIHSEMWACLAGLAAFLGHLFPIYLRFQGGKGVATFIGVFLTLSPLALLADLGIFLLVLYQTRYVSLGSIIAAALLPVILLVFSYSYVYVILAVIMGGFIILRHRDNIQRLKQSRETKFGE
ncbi:MAG: glycerol-3-phosphate 1-O-acyltransferase PlsY [Proteobacteria bacterium]|nr:glycerol-3-phosphate 1-O-acyltransferase PlsY [Pseudomonadota bacterium]